MAGVPNAIDRLRRPEYTGENRCLPCTVVNLAIAAAVGVVLGVLWLPVAGGVAFALSALVIYLRGYVVPGTPTLTKRYLPIRVLELFGKRPEERRSGAIDDSASGRDAHAGGSPGDDPGPAFVEDTTEFLFDARIVRECEDSSDLCLTDWFRDAWEERLTDFVGAEAAQIDRLAEMLDTDAATLRITEAGDAIVVERDGEPIGSWISRSAFAADMAAEAVLDERIEGWSTIPVGQRSDMLSPLRGFLQTCPLCGGDITLELTNYDEDDPETCCFESEIYTARCADCEELFVEIEQMQDDDDQLGSRA